MGSKRNEETHMLASTFSVVMLGVSVTLAFQLCP